MATGSKIYLTGFASDISVDTITLLANLGPGSSAGAASGSTTKTAITNTQTNPGTPIQMTSTAGGSVLCWATPPVAAAITISNTTMLVNTRGLESNAAANAAMGVKVTKYSSGVESTVYINSSTQTNLAELGTSDNIEGTSLGTAYSPTTVTSTTLARGDRLIIRCYIMNASGVQMASGNTVTLGYDKDAGDSQTVAAAGDTWIQLGNETIVFENGGVQVGTQTARPPTMQTGVTYNFGTEMIAPGSNAVTASGIDPSQP